MTLEAWIQNAYDSLGKLAADQARLGTDRTKFGTELRSDRRSDECNGQYNGPFDDTISQAMVDLLNALLIIRGIVADAQEHGLSRSDVERIAEMIVNDDLLED